MFRNWIVMGAAALVLGVVGCGGDGGDGDGGGGSGGSGGTGGGSKGTVVCNLFTKAEIEAALGNPVLDGNRLADQVCDWQPVDSLNQKSVTMQVFRGQADTFDATVTNVESSFSVTAQDLPGVGDRAAQIYYTTDAGSFFVGVLQIAATQGNDLIAITVGGIDVAEADAAPIAKTLAIQLLNAL